MADEYELLEQALTKPAAAAGTRDASPAGGNEEPRRRKEKKKKERRSRSRSRSRSHSRSRSRSKCRWPLRP